jgi:hypothetical protein
MGFVKGTQSMTQTFNATEILERALTEPGLISKAYSAFYGYSFGNQLLAFCQCMDRKITPGPIGTFLFWKDKGRFVRKGEKAIVLCMPVTAKRKATAEELAAGETDHTFTRFVYRPNWFVLSQTDGNGQVADRTVGDWNSDRALETLNVTEIPFDLMDGNTQGYAIGRNIAISDVAVSPMKTRFHELAHIVLGHTAEGTALTDGERTPRSLREVEAETVALICLEALGMDGAEYARGYIQSWYKHYAAESHTDGEPAIPERSAQKIFKAADQILKAGRPAESLEA